MYDSTGADQARHGKVSVRIADDRMVAFLVVEGPGPGGEPVTVEAALHKLLEAGVTFGIDQAAVEQAVASQGPEASTTVVARGTPAQNGVDGKLEFHPILTRTTGRPRVHEDGRVDLYDLGLVRSVEAGTILCTRTPPTPGVPGRNVLNHEIAPKPGREPVLRLGAGVAWTEDKLQVVAQTAGHAALVRDTLSVNAVYTVDEDVGPSTGNISFIGSVVVRGNILPGFRVEAQGGVEVQGGIDAGLVVAGGDVTVRYGIQGGNRGLVQAAGNVRARFIENCHVVAGGSVWVADGILHSRVEAGGRVEVLGRRGAIVGGKLAARECVMARFLGAEVGTPTEVAVGTSPTLRRELEQVRHQLGEVERQLHRTIQGLQMLKEQERRGALGPEKIPVVQKLAQAQFQLVAQRDELTARRNQLEAELEAGQGAWVAVQGTCYPGVRILIGSALYVVTDSLSRTKFNLNEQREVQIGPI